MSAFILEAQLLAQFHFQIKGKKKIEISGRYVAVVLYK